MSCGHREGLVDSAVGGGDGAVARREGGSLGVAEEQRASSSLAKVAKDLHSKHILFPIT